MKHQIKKIIHKTVFFREINRIIHDKNIFLLVLIAPILYVFFYGSVYINNSVRHLDIGLIDRDNSSLSAMVRQYCLADPMLDVHAYHSLEEAKKDLYRQKICAYILIPQNFEKNIKRGNRSPYSVYVSTAVFMQSNEISKHLLQINATLGAQIDAKFLLAKGYSKIQSLHTVLPVRTDLYSSGNAVYGYGNFVLIGLFVLILQQLLLIGMCESVAEERQSGNMPVWFDHSGNNLFRMLTGKMTPYLIFFMTYYLFYLSIPFSVFHLHQKANYLHLILLAIPFFITVAEMALLFGSFFKEKLQALQIMALTSVPFFLVCGYAWPFFSLHPALKLLSSLFPTYFMMISFQSMTQLGSRLSDQYVNWFWMWGQVIFYGVLMYWRYIVLTRNMRK